MCSPTGRVHAGGVRAMEAAHSSWDWNHRHGWATGAQRGEQERLAESSEGADAEEAVSIISLDHLAQTRATGTELEPSSLCLMSIPVTVSSLDATRSCKDIEVIKRFFTFSDKIIQEM